MFYTSWTIQKPTCKQFLTLVNVGPLPHTLTDFWRLVVQEKVPTIVMVTNLKEGKKEKCHQYWPDTGSVDYGPLNVTITDQQIFADYTLRSFQVRVSSNSMIKATNLFDIVVTF